ncbi:Rv3235 family protein [Tenggerimyces flavus]|uniref:Rv3235 family protein n=1 Tax=Tenggerimyces flavus TaxID=1708749 RepID=A0ABV7YQ59_9ACTN|nr:Rv3235 family protein [Tenggerimyces flavus]MBM7786217.1 hypothetical protein [Tenggerimyces flavus]
MTANATLTGTNVRRLPRRVPVPVAEPPYDDERGYGSHDQPATQGTLALDLRTSSPAPEIIEPRHLTVVRTSRRRRDEEDGEDKFFARQPTAREALPHPKPWCGRFVQALVEVLAGDRPATQLARWTNDEVFADVVSRVSALGLSTTAAVRTGLGRAVVRSVHVSEPRDGVAESAVHIKHGGRSRAVAVRMEGLDGRWQCTALVLG